MKYSQVKAAIASVVLLLAMAACSPNDTSGDTGTTPTALDSPTASAEPSGAPDSSSGRLQSIPERYATEEQVVSESEVSVPASQPPAQSTDWDATSEWRQSVDDQATSYWSSDWCHYFTGADGQTYGETCVRASTDNTGATVADQYVIYRYNPNNTDKLGLAILEMYTGFPDYTTYRDLTDPMFNTVSWVSFPTAVQPLTQDHYWVAFQESNGQLTWYTLSQILAMGANGSNGQPNGMTAPSWNPSITVWSYPMLSGITNSLQQIPSFIP